MATIRTSNYSERDSVRPSVPLAAVASVGLFMGLTLSLTAPFIVLKTPLPYMATPKRKLARALSTVRRRSSSDGGVFVDLGSGDGEAVYQAARLGWKAVGYELNWTLWLLAQGRRYLCWDRSLRTEFRRADFFQSRLPANTTAVMIFGVTPLMRPLSEKLAVECAAGTHILSYRFLLPTQEANRSSGASNGDETLLHAKIVYNHEEMRIYQVLDKQNKQQ